MTEHERLTLFLYLVLRDAVNFGALEKALEEVRKVDKIGKGVKYSEAHNANYAAFLASQILKKK